MPSDLVIRVDKPYAICEECGTYLILSPPYAGTTPLASIALIPRSPVRLGIIRTIICPDLPRYASHVAPTICRWSNSRRCFIGRPWACPGDS